MQIKMIKVSSQLSSFVIFRNIDYKTSPHYHSYVLGFEEWKELGSPNELRLAIGVKRDVA